MSSILNEWASQWSVKLDVFPKTCHQELGILEGKHAIKREQSTGTPRRRSPNSCAAHCSTAQSLEKSLWFDPCDNCSWCVTIHFMDRLQVHPSNTEHSTLSLPSIRLKCSDVSRPRRRSVTANTPRAVRTALLARSRPTRPACVVMIEAYTLLTTQSGRAPR